tara:strand:+ start:18501 stop:19610 length:1110 start_codon:yes stop_codon:yes gene_type:complete
MDPIPFVDLKSQYISLKTEIDSAIQEVVENTNFIGGKPLDKFSKKLANLLSVKHVVPVANGTDAIFIALKQLGIGPGDEVLTTAHSWISTSETISQTGAKPVFIDTNEFYCIDEKLIEEKINAKTKAIVPVHLYGHPCDMTTISKLSKKYKIFIVEDCAQAIMTKWSNKFVGTYGDAGTLSFFPGKNLGAYGDAGGIITDRKLLFKKMSMYANHGSLIKHQHKIEGLNSRMDTIQAAVLNVKIKYLKKWIKQRRKAAEIYTYYLKDIEEIKLPKERKNAFHTYHLYVIRTQKRSKLISYMNDRRISTGIHYPKALPMLDCYKSHNLSLEEFPNACDNSKTILSLPIYPEINEAQIKYVSESIKNYFKNS